MDPPALELELEREDRVKMSDELGGGGRDIRDGGVAVIMGAKAKI